jgi:hypothetical protein
MGQPLFRPAPVVIGRTSTLRNKLNAFLIINTAGNAINYAAGTVKKIVAILKEILDIDQIPLTVIGILFVVGLQMLPYLPGRIDVFRFGKIPAGVEMPGRGGQGCNGKPAAERRRMVKRFWRISNSSETTTVPPPRSTRIVNLPSPLKAEKSRTQ